MTKWISALVALALTCSLAHAQSSLRTGTIMQLFSYRLTDADHFKEGYRTHLRWHADRNDQLVWYAWTVHSGARRGLFIDGTAGATFDELDSRPDLPGDGADFAKNAAPYAQAVDVETWALLPSPTTATPLENRTPSALLDIFLLEVGPANISAFEQYVAALKVRKQTVALSWYRKIRGGGAATYMIAMPRARWADLAQMGDTLQKTLARAYALGDEEVATLLGPVQSVSIESWRYEPRYSLIPGTPLAD